VTTTYRDLVSDYLADPGPAALDRLRAAARTAPNFTADLDVTLDRTVAPLIASGAYDEAVTALEDLMPGALLSPSAHGALSQALGRSGRTEDAEREATVARAALDGILATGDGSAEHPWSVLRVGDEYDVLRSLRRTRTRQTLVRDAGRTIDVLVCDDGSELHFDVTGLVGRA
jgi:hypothetical protein